MLFRIEGDYFLSGEEDWGVFDYKNIGLTFLKALLSIDVNLLLDKLLASIIYLLGEIATKFYETLSAVLIGLLSLI
jgi:hypothetical protein